MKKCPNCQKTFEDNMKFCQSDGTSLVVVADNKPEADPYATMIANKGDVELPPEESKDEIKEEKVELDPFATMVAPSQGSKKEESEILEVVGDDKKDDEIDPLKTMVVSGNTAGKVELDIPDEIKDKPVDDIPSEAQTIISPDIPKFDEPNIAPPNLNDEPPKAEDGTPAIDENKGVPSSPFEAETPLESQPAPIPSPFDDSMPPRVSAPQSPPFEKAESTERPMPINSVSKDDTPKSPFSEENKPFAEPESDNWNQAASPIASVNNQNSDLDQPFDNFNNNDELASNSPDANQNKNQTLAIVSLVTGILGLCCGILGLVGLITGFMAKNNIDAEPNVYGGRGLAIAGMIIGAIGFSLNVIFGIIQLIVMFD